MNYGNVQFLLAPTCSDERFRFIIESSATRCQMTKMKSEASDESIDSKKSFARPVKPINYSDASRRQYIRGCFIVSVKRGIFSYKYNMFLERRDAALFKCPHCNRKYFTKRKLWFHKKKVHLGKAAFSVGSGLLPSGMIS